MTASRGSNLRRASSALLFATVVFLSFAQPVLAGTQTSKITDPEGDAFFNLNINSGVAAPGYQDIIEASVSLRDGRFLFTMDVASAVPTNPALPSGARLLEWSWRIDTNPATFPAGFPWPPGYTAPAEFMVFVLWDGSGFMAILIDRTGAPTGGETVVTSVPLSVKGTEISTSVYASLMDGPLGFRWFAATNLWAADLGTEGYIPLDNALAPGSAWATWPG